MVITASITMLNKRRSSPNIHQSLSPLLFPEYRRCVLTLLLLRPEEALHGREVARIPVMRLADAHAKGAAATLMYEPAWPSRQFNGLPGACHGLEIGYDTERHLLHVACTRARSTVCVWRPAGVGVPERPVLKERVTSRPGSPPVSAEALSRRDRIQGSGRRGFEQRHPTAAASQDR